MTTAASIIRQALGHLRVRGAGQAVSGNDAADMLVLLNTMLDAWRVEELYAVATQTLAVTLPANTQTLTVGPAQAVNIDPRPIAIEDGSFFTSGTIDYPMCAVTEAEFNGIAVKNITGALGPEVFFYRPNYPIATLDFYPRSSAAVPLKLLALVQVPRFAALTTDFNLAPGYERALAMSLAEEAAPTFEAPLSPGLVASAQNARRLLKRNNARVPQLRVNTRGAGLGEAYLDTFRHY